MSAEILRGILARRTTAQDLAGTHTHYQGLNQVISPAALASGATNNWAPTGLSTANVIRVTTDNAGSTLNGLTAQAANTEIVLINIGPTGALTLAHAAGGSTEANRFALAGGTSSVIDVGGGARLWYDGTSSRWRHIDRIA